MIEAKKILNNLMNLTLSAFLSFSLIYALTSSLLFDYSPYEILLFAFALTCIWHGVFYNKLSLKITGAVIVGMIVICSVLLALTGKLVRLAFGLSSFFTWIVDYTQGYDTLNRLYQPYLALILCVLITILIYIFTIKKFNFIVLLVGGIAIYATQWMYEIFVSYLSFYSFLVIILTYYFISILNKNITKEPNEYVNRSIFSAWMLPISIIVVIICLMIPAKSKPIEFPWLDKKINSLYKYVTNAYRNYKSFEFFSIETTGFGENSSRLGGKVKLDKTLVMKVEAPKVAYLRGGSREIYTGSKWTNIEKKKLEITDNSKLSNDELFEMLMGFRLMTDDAKFDQKYLSSYDMKISYQNLLMKTIFAPSKTHSLDFSNIKSYQAFIDSNSILSSKNISAKNFAYTLKAYNMDLKNKDFIRLLKNSRTGFYDEILKKVDLLNKAISNKFKQKLVIEDSNIEASSRDTLSIYYSLTLDELKWIIDNINEDTPNKVVLPPRLNSQIEYIYDVSVLPNPTLYNINSIDLDTIKKLASISKGVYSTYLQLPEKLPSRVKNLAVSITSTKRNNYDKVKAIEDYLSKNYTYTLTPKVSPRHRDFVDYFLFETKEGYCTYYATAMTIMVRSLGIPARYVDGYILPPTPKNGKTYEVTNEQAHAWVEVYFDGYGWVPFEPTAPFRSAFYEGKQSSAKFSSSFIGNSSYEEYLKHLRGYGNTNIDPNLIFDDDSYDEDENKKFYYIIGAVIFFSLIILSLISLILYNMFSTRYKLFRIRKMEPRESILHMYKYYVSTLTIMGYPIKTGETPLQYGQRVDSYIVFGKPKAFRLVTDKFLTARYSTKKLSEKDKQLVCEFYESIIKEAKDDLGKFKFFLKRFLQGKI